MNQLDHDTVLRRWLDKGADTAPDRFVQSALRRIETTSQRRRPWLLIPPIQRFALIGAAAVAAALVVAIGLAYVAMRQTEVGDEPTSTPSGMPSPTPSAAAELITTDQLAAISVYTGSSVMGVSNGVPSIHGPEPDRILDGEEALVAIMPPEASEVRPAGFAGARHIEFRGPLLDDPRTVAALLTHVALFETPEDAHRAFELVVDAHEAADGWNLDPRSTNEELGTERVHYVGPAYDRAEATIYVWRVRNAVLAAAVWDDTSPLILIDVARRMDRAAHRTP